MQSKLWNDLCMRCAVIEFFSFFYFKRSALHRAMLEVSTHIHTTITFVHNYTQIWKSSKQKVVKETRSFKCIWMFPWNWKLDDSRLAMVILDTYLTIGDVSCWIWFSSPTDCLLGAVINAFYVFFKKNFWCIVLLWWNNLLVGCKFILSRVMSVKLRNFIYFFWQNYGSVV